MTRVSWSVKKGWESQDNVNNEKSDSSVKQNKARKIGRYGDKSTTKWQEQNDLRLWPKQTKKDHSSAQK